LPGFEIIAVDANPLLSAVLGGRALDVFDSSHVEQFITTSFTLDEVRNHIPMLARKPKLRAAGLMEREMLVALEAIPVDVYTRDYYNDRLEEAKHRIKDPKDVDLLALALKTGATVWTNDTDFEQCGVPHLDTAKLVKELERL